MSAFHLVAPKSISQGCKYVKNLESLESGLLTLQAFKLLSTLYDELRRH